MKLFRASIEGEGRLYRTRSPEETSRLGARLARAMPIPAVVLLTGELGSGKTTLVRGIAVGLGLSDGAEVHSPSFKLINRYRGKCVIHHVDLYRIDGASDLATLGLDEFMGVDGVTIVEWGERLQGAGPPTISIRIQDLGGERRRIEVRRPGGRHA